MTTLQRFLAANCLTEIPVRQRGQDVWKKTAKTFLYKATLSCALAIFVWYLCGPVAYLLRLNPHYLFTAVVAIKVFWPND